MIVSVCTSQSLPPLRPCLTPHFRQGWGCECTSRLASPDLGFADPRIVSTNPESRPAVCLRSTPLLLVLGLPYLRLPFLHPNATVNLLANMCCLSSPSLILRLVVFIHASLKFAQPLEYFIRCTSLVLTLTSLSRPLRKIRTQTEPYRVRLATHERDLS